MIRSLLSLLVFLCVITLYLFIMILPATWWSDHFFLPPGEPVEVVIHSGQNAKQIALGLEKQKVSFPRGTLGIWFQRYGIDRKLRPGRYRVIPGTPWEIAKQFKNSKPKTVNVTIIPGTSMDCLVSLSKTSSVEDFLKGLDESNFPRPLRPFLPKEKRSRIAFLLPETYSLSDPNPSNLVIAASSRWWQMLGNRLCSIEGAKKLEALAIMASLVEREAVRDDERSIIAGVFLNRLKKKMPLQIDASIVYAWNLRGRKLTRVTYRDLEIDSPYNTYKYRGLPPGPISVPSYNSWISVFEPMEHCFLFYVAKGKGAHAFSKSYKEHLSTIRKVRGK